MLKIKWTLCSLLTMCLLLNPTILQVDSMKSDDMRDEEVKSAVETWVRFVTADARPDALIEKIEPYIIDGTTYAYIAHLNNSGYCLCGANKLVLPVYLYSPQGTFEPDNPDLQYILHYIKERTIQLQGLLENDDIEITDCRWALLQREQFWEDLINGNIPTTNTNMGASVDTIMIELDLRTCWHQNEPYNNLCPNGDGGRCVVGCVATAMSQIMKYWDWPPAGTSSSSYVWDGDQTRGGNVGGGTLTATYSDPYDWDNMANEYIQVPSGFVDEDGNLLTQGQVNAVAEICYEAGVSVEMDYGVDGSSAGTDIVKIAFEKYFLYNAIVENCDIEALTTDIQWLRPIWFRGGDQNGPASDPYRGHAWVIYGYNKGTDPSRQFLMNMGWGRNDAHLWFACDRIDTDGNGVMDFWDGQRQVGQIAPTNVKFVGADDNGDGSPGDPYKNINEAIDEAPDGATIIFKAGSVNTWKAKSKGNIAPLSKNDLVINRPFTLKGYNAIIGYSITQRKDKEIDVNNLYQFLQRFLENHPNLLLLLRQLLKLN